MMEQERRVPAGPGEGQGFEGDRPRVMRAPPEGPYVAVVGGSETCGRGLAEPYPALLGRELGVACVDLGRHNASVEAFLRDPGAVRVCQGAALTVLAVTGAANLSNRLYSVHPRRNDRFTRPAPALRVLFPEVDFAEICFTRHLLLTLRSLGPDRFEIVREELRIAWAARMEAFLDRIGPRVVLLWFAPHPPPPAEAEEGPLGTGPLFVSAPMLEALRPRVRAIVTVTGGPPGGPLDAGAHRGAAEALAAPLRAHLPPPAAQAARA